MSRANINYQGLSRNAIHEYCEGTYTIPYLESVYGKQLEKPEQWPEREKNADRKLSFTEAPTITLERKHDRSAYSPQMPIEYLGNQPNGKWKTGRTRVGQADHRQYVSDVFGCAAHVDNKYLGLGTADLSHLGKHYTQIIKAYPVGRSGDYGYDNAPAEMWLLDTVKLQEEIAAHRLTMDIGATNSEKRGETWTVVMTYAQFPSIHKPTITPNITGSIVLGPIDISGPYADLWLEPTIPADYFL